MQLRFLDGELTIGPLDLQDGRDFGVEAYVEGIDLIEYLAIEFEKEERQG